MSIESLQPFTPTPTEIQAHILSFADTDTLAKACGVSFAFLELAAPLLYREIRIVGPVRLEEFLRLRANVQVPQLAPFLDLSLVVELVYIDVPGDDFRHHGVCLEERDIEIHGDGPHPFIPFRLLPSGNDGPLFSPLRLDALHLLLASGSATFVWQFFDPVDARLEIYKPAGHRYRPQGALPSPHLTPRTRLRNLILVDAPSMLTLAAWQESTASSKRLWLVLSCESESEYMERGLILGMVHAASSRAYGDPSLIEMITIQVQTQRVKDFVLRKLAKSPNLAKTLAHIKPAGDEGLSEFFIQLAV